MRRQGHNVREVVTINVQIHRISCLQYKQEIYKKGMSADEININVTYYLSDFLPCINSTWQGLIYKTLFDLIFYMMNVPLFFTIWWRQTRLPLKSFMRFRPLVDERNVYSHNLDDHLLCTFLQIVLPSNHSFPWYNRNDA